MSVPTRHVLHQGPVIAAMGRAVVSALKQRVSGAAAVPPPTPGPEISRVLTPRPVDLVRDYVRHVGGDPASYRHHLPPHLFPQWSMALATRTLEGLPYPMHRVLNGGCRLQINAALPNDEPLLVRARLERIDDNDRRIVIEQRVTTSTRTVSDGLVAHLFAIVPRQLEGDGQARRPARERPRVPDGARELAFWRLGERAGLDFAKLTGDFNPVHWIPAYARAFGFGNTILHGFATLARAIEGLNRELFSGATPLTLVDVQFTRPLVLPARVGLYVGDDQAIFVGDAPGGPAYLVGRYE